MKKSKNNLIYIYFLTSYYERRSIFTKSGAIGHDAFLKQRKKSNIIFLENFNGAKRIVPHKGGNMKPRVIKQL